MRKSVKRPLICCLILLSVVACGEWSVAQRFEPNYDESQVPEYELPAILDEATDSADNFELAWSARRAEILAQFTTQMYGKQPDAPHEISCERFEAGDSLSGLAYRQQFHVTVSTEHGQHTIDLLVFTPKQAEGPVPTFLGLSFYGNHTVADDEGIAIPSSWSRDNESKGVRANKATSAGRGTSSSRWPVEMIIRSGCGLATAYYGDIDPDFHDEYQNGVHALFPDNRPSEERPDRWGSISAWAWGLSRLLDCLQEDVREVDGQRVVVIGHSRLGKTALWAGATDTRFAGAISNDSGCGGAALSRRAYGETVERINSSFPHWFCPNFDNFNRNESALPIDQHQLIALIAPRPVYVASASDDRWADPTGEFLSAKIGSQVYKKFGFRSLELEQLPLPNSALISRVSYHLREGKHDLTDWDWRNYITFMEQLR